MNATRRSGAQNFGALLSTQVIGGAIRFVYLIVIARHLAPSDVGLYSLGMAIYLSLLGFISFGQAAFLSTRIGRRRASFPLVAAHSLTIHVVGLGLVTAVGLAAIITAEAQADTKLALSVLALTILARGLSSWVRSCYIALERATWIPRYELGFRCLEAASGTAALLLGGNLLVICILHLTFWALEAAASMLLLARGTRLPIAMGFDTRLIRRYLRASASMMIGLWLLNLFPQIGIMLMGRIQADAANVAQFAIALQLVTTLCLFPTSFANAVLPSVARAHRSRDSDDLGVLGTVLKICLVSGMLAAAVSALIGPWLVTLVFGEAYRMAGQAFANLMWGLGPYAATLVAIAALNAMNRRAAVTVSVLLMIVLQIVGALSSVAFDVDPVRATMLGFLAAACLGMASSLRAIDSVLRPLSRPGSHAWWPAPLLLLIVMTGLGTSGLVSAPWLAALGLPATIAAALSLIARRELGQLLLKAGLRRGILARWLPA